MKLMKIMILGALFTGVALVAIRFSFARILVSTDLEVDTVISRGDEHVRNENINKAWSLYKDYLTQKENIDHVVIESEPGYYRNAKVILLEKMAQILEGPNLPSEIKIEIETFFKHLNFSNFLDGNEKTRKTFIEESRLYLPSTEGFTTFDQLGDFYYERGDCEQAVSLWEEARNVSIGYKNVNKKGKMLFSAKLGFCYKQLGWNDKLKTLFEENPELTQLEGEEILAGFERIKEALKKLSEYTQACPMDSGPSSTEEFSIQRKEQKNNEGTYFQNELCLEGEHNWCFEKNKYLFLSRPLILKNTVYIVATSQNGDLILLTIDKQTGRLLNEQFINSTDWKYIEISRHEPFDFYKLFLKNGKIQLPTENSYHEFNLDGTLNLSVDLTHELISQEVSTKYDYTKKYKDDYVNTILRKSNSDDFHRNVRKAPITVEERFEVYLNLIDAHPNSIVRTTALGELAAAPFYEIREMRGLPQYQEKMKNLMEKRLYEEKDPLALYYIISALPKDKKYEEKIVAILDNTMPNDASNSLIHEGLRFLKRTASEAYLSLAKKHLDREKGPVNQEIIYRDIIGGRHDPDEKVKQMNLDICTKEGVYTDRIRQEAIQNLPETQAGIDALRAVLNTSASDPLKVNSAGLLLKRGEGNENIVSTLLRFYNSNGPQSRFAFTYLQEGINNNSLPIYKKVLNEMILSEEGRRQIEYIIWKFEQEPRK